jgi:drug/metabolite transporter (DMT)-like permease
MTTGALVAGMACAAAAAACFDGAVAFQALEARRVPRNTRMLLLRLVRSRRWLIATGIAALGWPLQLAALRLAPLTVVQPMLASGLVVLLIAAVVVLGERPGPRELASVGAIAAGIAVLGWSAPDLTVDGGQPWVIALALGLLALLALAPFAITASLRSGPARRLRTTHVPWLGVAGAGAAFAATGVASKMLADALGRGSAVGVVGWAAATGLFALMGTSNDMSALQELPATSAAPVMLAIEIVVPVALAPAVAGERWSSASGGTLGVLIGLAVVTVGAAALASAPTVTALDARPTR